MGIGIFQEGVTLFFFEEQSFDTRLAVHRIETPERQVKNVAFEGTWRTVNKKIS